MMKRETALLRSMMEYACRPTAGIMTIFNQPREEIDNNGTQKSLREI